MKDWQVYSSNGTQISGSGISKADAFKNGIPHAAAHVWIWRKTEKSTELLFQKCAPKQSYKVGLLDISAAGHVDISESELVAAVRELNEEIGLVVGPDRLYLAGVEHFVRKNEDTLKDEFRYIYTLEWNDTMELVFNDGEVEGVEWVAANTPDDITTRTDFGVRFVQHSTQYFNAVFSGINGQVLTQKRKTL
jgi:isopentenyldiphosphate isomerase